MLAQISAFLEVARRGSISRAAESLYVTQPTLTARIQHLETELGEPLFTRTRQGTRLTDTGRAFLPYAERAMQALEEGQRLVAGQRGRVAADARGRVARERDGAGGRDREAEADLLEHRRVEEDAGLAAEALADDPAERDARERVARAVLDGAAADVAVHAGKPDLAHVALRLCGVHGAVEAVLSFGFVDGVARSCVVRAGEAGEEAYAALVK